MRLAPCMFLLLTGFVAQSGAAERAKVQVRFELAEPGYVRERYADADARAALEQLVEDQLRSALQDRFLYLEFVDEAAPVVLTVKLDSVNSPVGRRATPVHLEIALTGPGLQSEPDAVTWPFRTADDYNKGITPASSFSQSIAMKFSLLLGEKKDQYVKEHLRFIPLTKEGEHVQGSDSVAIPVKCHDFQLDPLECEFLVYAKTRAPLRPTKQYEAKASGTIEDAEGAKLPGHYNGCLQAVLKEMSPDEMIQGVDVVQVFVSRYVRAVSCPEPEPPSDVEFEGETP